MVACVFPSSPSATSVALPPTIVGVWLAITPLLTTFENVFSSVIVVVVVKCTLRERNQQIDRHRHQTTELLFLSLFHRTTPQNKDKASCHTPTEQRQEHHNTHLKRSLTGNPWAMSWIHPTRPPLSPRLQYQPWIPLILSMDHRTQERVLWSHLQYPDHRSGHLTRVVRVIGQAITQDQEGTDPIIMVGHLL